MQVNPSRDVIGRETVLVFALALFIRVYAAANTFIVNPDGVLYIHQARLLWAGQWNQLTPCGLSYLSIYPILIAGFYPLFPDWVLAARSVSVLFGFASLIPIYLLVKTFVDRKYGLLCILIYALTPVLVGRSADIVRGPVFWFFLSLGLYLVARKKETAGNAELIIGCVCFLSAAWARIEAVLFIPVTGLFILIGYPEKRIKKLIIFFLPLIVTAAAVLAAAIVAGVSPDRFARMDAIMDKFSAPIAQYGFLRDSLRHLAASNPDGITEFFLPEARNMVWLVALGTLVNRALEAFFYPFFAIVCIGMYSGIKDIRHDIRNLYFLMLAVSGTLLLYVHLIQTWMIYYRFLAIVMIPCAIFSGYGIRHIDLLVRSRFRLKESAALAMICLLILGAGLPKNLKHRGQDKQVFVRIGHTIRQTEAGDDPVLVSTSVHTHRWLMFYANRELRTAPCPQQYEYCWENLSDDPSLFLNELKEKGIGFVLWEQRHWSKKNIDLDFLTSDANFRESGRWHHPDTGTMVLFRYIG